MKPSNPLDKLVAYSLSGGLPLLFFSVSIVFGLLALKFMPREEEPQIVVPMVEISVSAPGLSANQIERQVTTPMEKLLAQIPGVENVYSISTRGKTLVTLRFYVGENRENAILNTYNKLLSNKDKIPNIVDDWIVKPIEVDDVPIVILGLWSDNPRLSNDYDLRRIADELSTYLQAIRDTSQVNVSGGRSRIISIQPNSNSLAGRQSAIDDIVQALKISNNLSSTGNWTLANKSILLESGDAIRSIKALEETVINVVDGTPVFLKDVAEIIDGPEEVKSYSNISFADTHDQNYPMVTLSIAKQRGTNAVSVANNVHKAIEEFRNTILPPNIHVKIIRDYGASANEKVDNLASSLAFAVVTVVIFIAVFLGWRPALVIGLAVPISYGITLALDMAFGYTINRVTLFALILSLGLLVDDPITGVDNIERFYREKTGSLNEKIVGAISELKTPLIMSTITIVLAFIPLAFITGMMGPYMAPMAFNVPISVIVSTLVAFMVTPWLARKILVQPNRDSKPINATTNSPAIITIYSSILLALLTDKRKALLMIAAIIALFTITACLPLLRLVPIKLLPFDNKNELQIIIDMPESTTLESTAATAKIISDTLLTFNEVETVASYIGEPSPIDFNGMVRNYHTRNREHLADLRILLVDKSERQHQSHGIVLRLHSLLSTLPLRGAVIKIVEVPPGPPVMSTLVAEVYGSNLTNYEQLQAAAEKIQTRLKTEPFVSEIDTSIEAAHKRIRYIANKTKAALSGISSADINNTLIIANRGYIAGYLQVEREAKPLPLEVRLPVNQRSSLDNLRKLQVKGRAGISKQDVNGALKDAPNPLVALGELGTFEYQEADKSIQHKDLKPVVYVTANINGRTPAAVISDLVADQDKVDGTFTAWQNRSFFNPGGGEYWHLPENITVVWSGEGEWKITKDVFIDMGIAFSFALVGIFLVLKIQTASTTLALIIMSAIPLTIIGIMPGFFLINHIGERNIAGTPDPVLFTATAMIGMIALAGIVVRNSLILVEFITQARLAGLNLKEALIKAGAIRMRPILLTAGTTLLGNLVITLDPVFSGLAIAIIFGIIASTTFTLFVIPVVYFLIFEKVESIPGTIQ